MAWNPPAADRILFEGRHMRLLERGGWEYVEHRSAPESVMIVALTDTGEIVLCEEHRPALGVPCISLPAGLAGDEGPESLEDAARRELSEETGFTADSFEPIGRGPGAMGSTSEVVNFFLARSARRAGEQAAADRALIRVHVVLLERLEDWCRAREAEGLLIDPKLFAGLHLGVTPAYKTKRDPAG
jgi:ADP-ribose pyrophosphatase